MIHYAAPGLLTGTPERCLYGATFNRAPLASVPSNFPSLVIPFGVLHGQPPSLVRDLHQP